MNAANRADTPAPSGQSAPKSRWRWLRWALPLALLALFLALVLLVAWLVLQQPYANLISLEERVWRLKYVGICLQLLAVAAAAWRWPALVAWGLRRGWLIPGLREAALALRVRAVGLMLIFIVFAEVGPGDLARLYRALLAG
jgi:hypothetical protein